MLLLKIPLPGLSINHSHQQGRPRVLWRKGRTSGRIHKVLASGGRIKTDYTRRYERDFLACLSEYDVQINSFLEKLEGRVGIALKAKYEFYFPTKTYFTKKGALNSKQGDTDNFVKITQDLICKKLNINDALVVEYTARRLPCHGDHAYIWASFEVVPVPKL